MPTNASAKWWEIFQLQQTERNYWSLLKMKLAIFILLFFFLASLRLNPEFEIFSLVARFRLNRTWKKKDLFIQIELFRLHLGWWSASAHIMRILWAAMIVCEGFWWKHHLWNDNAVRAYSHFPSCCISAAGKGRRKQKSGKRRMKKTPRRVRRRVKNLLLRCLIVTKYHRFVSSTLFSLSGAPMIIHTSCVRPSSVCCCRFFPPLSPFSLPCSIHLGWPPKTSKVL